MAGPIEGEFKVFTKDHGGELDKLLQALTRMQVYVGIPEETAPRLSEGEASGDEMSNAQLMYLHTNGSPLLHIPARPVIEPAIQADNEGEGRIAKELKQAALATLDGKPQEALNRLGRAGMAGQNAARAWFTDPRNGWPPNSPITATLKLEKLRGKARKEMKERLAAGEDVTSLVRPLIDTGQLRKSIIYIIKGEHGELGYNRRDQLYSKEL